MKKIISIVAACYNEEKNIPLLYERVRKTFEPLSYDFELIYVDNVSKDGSYGVYQQLIAQDHRVKVICMARNTGNSQPSFMAGLRHASGSAAVLIDGDIQDPPELIPAFIEKWEQGYEVVYGTRAKRRENIIRRIGFTCFYRVFKLLSYLDIPLDAGDFSLMDKKVIDVITALPEHDIYLRGLRAWAGFRQTGVPYTRDDRQQGHTSNSFGALFFWAKKAIVNFSYKPLEYISRLAFAAVLGTGIAGCVFLALYFEQGAPRGFPTLLMAMFIFNTIQLLALGVMAEYMIRIFTEVKARPTYVIREILTQAQPPYHVGKIVEQSLENKRTI